MKQYIGIAVIMGLIIGLVGWSVAGMNDRIVYTVGVVMGAIWAIVLGHPMWNDIDR